MTPIFLRDHLTDYGLIILVAHGFRETGTKKTYILTDLRWHGNSGIVADNSVGFEWKDRNIAILKSGDGNLYWTLPPEYFNSIKGQYEENSIMISIVCNSLTYENNIGDNLLSKGLGAYIGYKGSVNTEVGKYGLSIILRLFANPANYKQFEFKKEDSPELSLKESFEMYDESPYFDKDMVCSAVLKTNKEDIAIFSTISEAEEVNLGLLSNFASHNLGANSPEQSGKFYEVYADGNYLLDGYITGSQYDFVKKSMGSKWYTPTSIDYGNLISLCAHDYKFKYKGVLGARLLGPSGESIFLPYPGFKIDNKKIGANILAYYPCGDMSLPVEYDPNQLEWNEQDHAIMGLADSRLTVYNYDGEFMNFLQNCFHNNLINANRLVWIDIDAGAKKVIITETERLKFSYQFVLRPAKRNLFYKEQWNQFDKEMDKSLKRIKRVTLDDIKKAAKLHYPDYKIVVE